MHGFFETLLRPDQEEDPERTVVARAANILQVGEFQLLQLAYHAWHNQDMPQVMFDRMFASYMLHGEVPHWARHYAETVLDLSERGLLDPNNPAYHRYDHDYVRHVPDGVRKFIVASMIVVVVIFGGLWIGHIAGVQQVTSVLPPYFEIEQLSRESDSVR